MTNYRAQTFVNRGIIRYDMGDRKGALKDFNIALDNNPDAWATPISIRRWCWWRKASAGRLAAINKGIALGATNLQVAYYSRGEIEDDAGHYARPIAIISRP